MSIDYAVRAASLLAIAAISPVGVDRHPMSFPQLDRVEPSVAKPGVLVTGFGANLNQSRLVDLVLSRPETAALCRIIEQQENLIRFRIPSSLPAGQYRIVLVVSNWWGSELIDQPTFLEVLDGTD
jgi:hypothetical protein